MHRRTVGRAVLAGVAAAATVLGTAATAPAAGTVTPVVTGLTGPRGVAVGPAGRVVYATADGSVYERVMQGAHAGKTVLRGKVPAGFIAPAVDVTGRGELLALTAGGPPGSGAATLYRFVPGSTTPRKVADIGAYQQGDPDPYNLADDPRESNPFGVAALPGGGALVSDAANNDLLHVYPNGHIVTVARLKPRVVTVPDALPDSVPGEDGKPEALPPGGTPLPAEAVATSVAVGADGAYYVGELRGFPATPGTSEIWRVPAGTVGAVCDPAAPATGSCRRFADGLTSIVDLAGAPDGSILAVELAKASWLQVELGIGAPTGAVVRVPAGGGAATEVAELTLPGGVAAGRHGAVYATAPLLADAGPGAVYRIG